MKKKLVASLAAAMVLGVAGTSFAATNPFTDVPAKHWSYDAVSKLAKAGVVDGYGDGTYKGDKVMSRYEMAQIVAKAMAHSDKATAEQKATIDKLSVEFASELEGLNVRVAKLEKNSSTIKVTGEARLRYQDQMQDNITSVNAVPLRTRIHLNGNINDQWVYYGRLQSTNNLRGDTGATVTMDNAYVKGSLIGTTATIGRFDYKPNYGLMIDSTLNGVNFAFGNVLKANLFYGKDNNIDNFRNNTTGLSADYMTVTGAALSYGASKATNITGGYYHYKDKDKLVITDNANSAKVWELGFDSKLSPDWVFSTSYGKSNAEEQNKAYFMQLAYKGADKKKVGSFGAWVNYRNLEAYAAPRATFDGAYTILNQSVGAKGYEVGFNYTPMLNTVLRIKYVDLKPTVDAVSDKKGKVFQAQAEFFF